MGTPMLKSVIILMSKWRGRVLARKNVHTSINELILYLYLFLAGLGVSPVGSNT